MIVLYSRMRGNDNDTCQEGRGEGAVALQWAPTAPETNRFSVSDQSRITVIELRMAMGFSFMFVSSPATAVSRQTELGEMEFIFQHRVKLRMVCRQGADKPCIGETEV